MSAGQYFKSSLFYSLWLSAKSGPAAARTVRNTLVRLAWLASISLQAAEEYSINSDPGMYRLVTSLFGSGIQVRI